MPDSCADCSICFLVMPICTNVVIEEKPTVARMMIRDGTTIAGENRKIWATSSRELSDVRPAVMTMPIRTLQRLLTDMDRLFNSPALYVRKKLAGREIRRIIMEA